jgi:hypothetical protein
MGNLRPSRSAGDHLDGIFISSLEILTGSHHWDQLAFSIMENKKAVSAMA